MNGIYGYYNEQNDNKDLDDYNFPLKILLTGMRLSGKSTFVNLFFNKLLAFTSNDLEIGTLNTSEYDIKDTDNKNIIKLIDTPGINSKKRIKEKTLNEINKYIKEKKIDFILFFYNEGNFLEEGKSLLKLLDKSETPVFIIINKSRKIEDNDINEDIQSKILLKLILSQIQLASFLEWNQYSIKWRNLLGVQLKKTIR